MDGGFLGRLSMYLPSCLELPEYIGEGEKGKRDSVGTCGGDNDNDTYPAIHRSTLDIKIYYIFKTIFEYIHDVIHIENSKT